MTKEELETNRLLIAEITERIRRDTDNLRQLVNLILAEVELEGPKK